MTIQVIFLICLKQWKEIENSIEISNLEKCWVPILKELLEIENKPGTQGQLRKGLKIPMDGLTDYHDGLMDWQTDQRTEGGSII